jgi:hypothetical protein
MVKAGEIPMMATHWKHDITDLRSRAAAVMTCTDGNTGMSARTAAAVLAGIVGLVSRKWSTDVMQETCAALVRHDAAWSKSFVELPAGIDGRVTEATQLIAVVARGLLPIAGAENLRCALAFWASESDPAVWNEIAA